MWMVGVMTFLGMLALVAGVVARLRARTRARTRAPELDDESVEMILRRGKLWWEDDAPLDPAVIREEEDRFWNEARWDRAERWDEEGWEEGREPWQEGRS